MNPLKRKLCLIFLSAFFVTNAGCSNEKSKSYHKLTYGELFADICSEGPIDELVDGFKGEQGKYLNQSIETITSFGNVTKHKNKKTMGDIVLGAIQEPNKLGQNILVDITKIENRDYFEKNCKNFRSCIVNIKGDLKQEDVIVVETPILFGKKIGNDFDVKHSTTCYLSPVVAALTIGGSVGQQNNYVINADRIDYLRNAEGLNVSDVVDAISFLSGTKDLLNVAK